MIFSYPSLVMLPLVIWSRYCPICIPPNNWSFFFFLSLQLRSHLWKDTLWWCKYSAPHQNLPLDLASIDGSCLLQTTAFQFWYCLHIYQSALSLLLFHLFIYYWFYELTHSSFSVIYNSLLYWIILMPNCPWCDQWQPLPSGALWHTPIISFEHFITLWYDKMSWLTSHQPFNQPFL